MAETNEVVLFKPSKRTTEVETKLVPLTVIVNCESPTFFEVGEIEVVVGTGFLGVNGEPVGTTPVAE